MIDKERLMDALRCRGYEDDLPCFACAYYTDGKPHGKCEYNKIYDDAIAVVKAQIDREKPIAAEIEGGGHTWWHVCGECHGTIDTPDKYCRHCGRLIDWGKL
jgi:hypothetical protein